MITKRKHESGQAVLILAVALVGLLGFAALAIDGGMIYSDRRVAQNAADAAAMAAAGKVSMEMDKKGVNYSNFKCSDMPSGGTGLNLSVVSAISSARARALSNGFTIGATMTPTEGVTVTCGSINKGGWKDKYLDFKVRVSITTQTTFMQVVYPGNNVTNTVEAVSRVRPRAPWAFGYAIASLSTDCGQNDGGSFFDGTADVKITGGGVYSNSCIDKNGGSGSVTVSACDPPGSACGNTSDSVGIVALEEATGHIEKFDPAPTVLTSGTAMPAPPDPQPDCDALTHKTVSGNEIPAGIYDGLSLQNSDTMTLDPGLYCFDGDIKMTGGTLTGNGVTIVMRHGSITITGGLATLAASMDADPANHALRGLVIYMPSTNTGGLKLVGDQYSSYLGTVYAPKGSIEIGGGSGVQPTYNTQLVGNLVKVHGSALVKIRFDQVYDAEVKPRAELNQ